MTAPVPYVYPIVSVESVHDGDTLTAVIDLGFSTQRVLTIRLNGLDTPEVTGASKAAGIAVRDFVRSMVYTARTLTLESQALDKYGRSLGVVYLDGISLNKLLIASGRALPYDGSNRAGTWTAARLAAVLTLK